MYVERDAKILLIYYSIIGIVTFVTTYLVILFNQQRNPNDNFAIIQIMIFFILSILTIILAASSYSLKKEISSQKEYLQNIQDETKEQTVKIPYNKSGLYSIIVVTIVGIIGLLFLYNSLVLENPSNIHFQKGTLETVSLAIFIIIIILVVVLIIALKILMKRIKAPLYYEFKSCPRCGSSEVHMVEYSWWGGVLGPSLVHQVRCKKCGKSYDGSTGEDITRRITIYSVIGITIVLILIILRYIF